MHPESHAGKGIGRRRFFVITGLSVLLVAIGVVTWDHVSPRSSPLNLRFGREILPAIPRRERPRTLPAELFTGRAAQAYRFATERPDLLEQLPCYCGCYFTQGHQNLLDCFRDRHAENCEICQAIALRAAELNKTGYGIADIKALIDREFAPLKK
jgi:hypothetical protein